MTFRSVTRKVLDNAIIEMEFADNSALNTSGIVGQCPPSGYTVGLSRANVYRSEFTIPDYFAIENNSVMLRGDGERDWRACKR